jgi:hypothetical protein
LLWCLLWVWCDVADGAKRSWRSRRPCADSSPYWVGHAIAWTSSVMLAEDPRVTTDEFDASESQSIHEPYRSPLKEHFSKEHLGA